MTGGASLAGDDGTMHRTIEDALAMVDADEACVEIEAQAARVEAAGLSLICVDQHMWPICPPAYEQVCKRLGLSFMYPGVDPYVPFASIRMLSDCTGAETAPGKKAWLLDHVASLEPGLHYLCTHPAMPGPEIASLTRPDADNFVWTETYRRTDLEVLIDPDVRSAIDSRGIELVTAKDVVV